MARKPAKKPMAVRLTPTYEERIKALATVKNVDYDQMFVRVIDILASELEGQEKIAYEALLTAWNIPLEYAHDDEEQETTEA